MLVPRYITDAYCNVQLNYSIILADEITPQRLVMFVKLKGVRLLPKVSYMSISGRAIFKLDNTFLPYVNLPQGIRFSVIGQKLISFERATKLQRYRDILLTTSLQSKNILTWKILITSQEKSKNPIVDRLSQMQWPKNIKLDRKSVV